MKKFYRIVILFIIFIVLTTYIPTELNTIPKKENKFLKIQNIEITNNNLIKKNEIKKKLENLYGKNILLVNSRDIEKPLKTIDFLNKIEVKKKYPHTIIVKVYETKPMAIVYKNSRRFFIDNLSKLITYDEQIFGDKLPRVFGENAEKKFVDFYNLLTNLNFPQQTIKNYYYHQIDRWDLQLVNDQLIKLPFTETNKAIKQYMKLLENENILNYNIIDLRIDGKVIVE